MSSSSLVRLTRLATRETTYRTPVTSAGLVVRRTGGNAAVQTTSKASSEVRTDLQPTQVYRTDQKSTLKIDDEWVASVHDHELEDVFLAAWNPSAIITSSATAISASSSDNSFNRASGSFLTDGLFVGQMIKTGGFVASADNGVFRIVTVAALKITTNGTLVTEAAGTNSLIGARTLRPGTSDMWTTFEEFYSDLTSQLIYPGMVGEQFDLKFSHPSELTCSFSYSGGPPMPEGTALQDNGTITPYTANPVMESADHFKAAYEGGAALTAWLKAFTLTVKNPKRPLEAAGTLGAKGQGKSTFDVTGQIDVYNDANGLAIVAKHFAFTQSSWEFQLIDSNGNIQHIWLPAVYYTGGAPSAGAKDTDVMAQLPFTAVQGGGIGSMIQISAFQ